MTKKVTAPGTERRKAMRATRVLAIQHRLVKRNSKKKQESWSLSTTRNMSFTGILFLSDTAYKVGDILELNVVMSGIIEVVKGQAKVVRVVENGDTSFDVAVHFLVEKVKSRSAKKHF